MNKIEDILDKIEQYCHPKSIFIFGSRARNDYFKNSDWEIGVLFNKRFFVNEKKLKRIINPSNNIHVYPYEYKQFITGKINIPFQKNIFLREIVLAGKTLRREKIIEKIIPPPITVVNIMQDLKFSLARDSDAIVSYSRRDKKTASILFYKSCLFGTRDLILLLLKKFPISYPEIYAFSKKLRLSKEYRETIYHAYRVRQREVFLKKEYLFRNISYLTEFVEKKIVKYYKKWGDRILIH